VAREAFRVVVQHEGGDYGNEPSVSFPGRDGYRAISFFKDDHTFSQQNDGTLMIDRVEFASPVPVLGSIADFLFLRHHLKLFLQERNRLLKAALESDQWRNYLSSPE